MTHYALPMTHQINNATTHFIKKNNKKCLIHNRETKPWWKCNIVQFQLHYDLTYTDDRCVKKLVRQWQFTAAIIIYLVSTSFSLIVANNESCLNYMLPVNRPMQVGHEWKCIDPWPIWSIQKTDPFDPLTHRPIVYSALPPAPRDYSFRWSPAKATSAVSELWLVALTLGTFLLLIQVIINKPGFSFSLCKSHCLKHKNQNVI